MDIQGKQLKAEYTTSILRIKELINNYSSIEIGVRNDTYNLWFPNHNLALYYLLIAENITQSKIHFYLCGRLYDFYIKKPSSMHHFSHTRICTGILSDEPKLIRCLGEIWAPDFYSYMQNGSGYFAFGIQKIIQKDWVKLAWLTDELEQRVTKFKKWEFAHFDKEIFAGFLERDKSRIEAGLAGLTEKKYHRKRGQWDGNIDFISYPAVGYAKLAWLNGLEVEAVSPLIPRELLPIQPLNEYPEYDFMLNDPDGRIE